MFACKYYFINFIYNYLMKKLKLLTFVIGLLLANVAGFAQVPMFDWAKKVNGNVEANNYTISDIKADAAGNVYITGSIDVEFFGMMQESWGFFIAKYDSQGNQIWRRESADMGYYTSGRQIEIDKQGYIYLSGSFWEHLEMDAVELTGGDADGFILKFNPNGTAIWGVNTTTDWSLIRGYAYYSSINLDTLGNVYAYGVFSDTLLLGNNIVLGTEYVVDTNAFYGGYYRRDGFIVKYSSEGIPLWAKKLENPSYGDYYNESFAMIESVDMIVDKSGNSYIVGAFKDTLKPFGDNTPLVSAGGKDMFFVKYDADGNILWTKREGGTAEDTYRYINIDDNENIYLVGGTTSQVINVGGLLFTGSYFLAKCDKNGNSSWIRQGTGEPIHLDIEGNLYTHVSSAKKIVKYDALGGIAWEKGPIKHLLWLDVYIPDNIFITTSIYSSEQIQFDDLPIISNGEHYGSTFAKLGISNSIKGTIRRMTSANCADTTGAGLPYFVVKTPQGYYTLSNEQGKYRLAVPRGSGNYTVQSAAPQDFLGVAAQVCPANGTHTANFSFSEQPQVISEKNFGYNIVDCHKLIVNISSNRRRYCFENTTVVSYKNVGISTAANAYVLVKFPEHVTPQSSTLAWSSFDAATRTYRFELGNVAGNSVGQFTITDKTACDNINILGLSQCTQATIFPASSCPTPSNWNGASLDVYGKCLGNGVVRLGIYNETAAAMSDSVTYHVYLDSLLVGTKKVKLAAADTVKMQVLALGKTVRLEVEQVANHPTEESVSVTVEGCAAANGAVSQGFVNKFSQPNTASSKTQCMEIRGSYDPNDKQVFPQGFTAQHIVAPKTKLEYLIRFQNTGTDTAITVVVVDTLSSNFDLSSLEVGAASHAYKLDMQTRFGRTYLRWEFNNILLPDSGTNNLKSQGFVQFRIKPLSSSPLGTRVHNKAFIYFDYNPAIVTNETLTTFDNITFSNPNLGGAVTSNAKTVSQSWHLYPNPSKGGVFSAELPINSEVSVTDILGKELYNSKLSGGKHEIRLSEASQGIYFVRVSNAEGVSVKKLVVE